MKKLLFVLLSFCIVGCGYVNFQHNSVIVGIQLTALNAGSEFAYKHPEMVEDATKLCDAIIETKGNVDYLFELAKAEAAKLVANNQTQAASLEIIFGSVTVEGKVDLKKFKQAAIFFKKGMEIRN